MLTARLIQISILLAILASDFYFLSTGAVRPSLIVTQILMILTVAILTYSRSKLEVHKRNLNVRNGKHFKHE